MAKSEAQIKGCLEQKKAVLKLGSRRMGYTEEQTELVTKAEIQLLKWILMD